MAPEDGSGVRALQAVCRASQPGSHLLHLQPRVRVLQLPNRGVRVLVLEEGIHVVYERLCGGARTRSRANGQKPQGGVVGVSAVREGRQVNSASQRRTSGSSESVMPAARSTTRRSCEESSLCWRQPRLDLTEVAFASSTRTS